MTNFTKEQLESLYKSAKQIKAAQSQDLSANDYLQSVLMDKNDNLSQTEAANIVDRMETAIRDFNINYNRGIEAGSVQAEDTLKEAIRINNMSDEQAVNYLASTIVLMRNYGKDIEGLTDEALKTQAEEAIAGREINDATVQAMVKEAADAIRLSDVAAIDAKTAEVIAATPLDTTVIATIREQSQSPLYLSVAAYIAVMNGEVQLSENESSPESIALGVAAGMKIQEISADLSEGKIDLPTWTKYVKIAVGVSLALSVVVLATPIIVAFSLNMMLGGLIVFGSFTAALFCGIVLTSALLIFTGIKSYQNADKILDSYSKMFDKAISWMTNLNIKEKVKAYYNASVTKIKEYYLKAKDLLTQQETRQQTTEEPAPSIIEAEVVNQSTGRLMPG